MSKCENCLSKNVCRWYENGTGKNLCCADDFPCPEQKDKDRFIETPCKVGDMVYALWSVPTEIKYIVYCAEVKKISQYKKNCRLTTIFELEPIEYRGRRKEYYIDEFGKLVFLTKEEAEKALAERSGDNA